MRYFIKILFMFTYVGPILDISELHIFIFTKYTNFKQE